MNGKESQRGLRPQPKSNDSLLRWLDAANATGRREAGETNRLGELLASDIAGIVLYGQPQVHLFRHLRIDRPIVLARIRSPFDDGKPPHVRRRAVLQYDRTRAEPLIVRFPPDVDFACV